MKVNAVLFDFDGVIANTLTYHIRAWQQVFAEYDVEIFAEDVCLLEGQLAEEIGKLLAQQKRLSLDEATLHNLVQHKREIYNQITNASVYPASRKLIEQLQENSIKTALVTGATLLNIVPVTGEEFLKIFDAIITGNDVANTKPHPEPYLGAAKKLNVQPSECIVIENAPLGILAAKLAGMFCIAVKTTIKDEIHLKNADVIVEDMTALSLNEIYRFAK